MGAGGQRHARRPTTGLSSPQRCGRTHRPDQPPAGFAQTSNNTSRRRSDFALATRDTYFLVIGASGPHVSKSRPLLLRRKPGSWELQIPVMSALDCSDERRLRNRHRAGRQSRDRVGEELGVVERRIALRQNKGFAASPVSADIGQMRAAEQGAHAFGTEHNPAAVRGPTQPGFAFGRVDFKFAPGEFGTISSCAEVNRIQVAVWIIRRPATITGSAEEQPPAIRA